MSQKRANQKVTSSDDMVTLVKKWLALGVEHVVITRGAKYYGNQSGKIERLQNASRF